MLLSVSSLCFTIYVQESHIFPQQEGLVFEDELSDPQLEVNGQGGDSTSINVLKILEDAEAQITDEIKEKLPSDEDVEKLYGSSVRIEGLERCEVRYLGITIFPTVVHRFRTMQHGTGHDQHLATASHLRGRSPLKPRRIRKLWDTFCAPGSACTPTRLWAWSEPVSTRKKAQALRL